MAAFVSFRRTFRIGGSIAITIPDSFCEYQDIKEGETVVVEYTEEGLQLKSMSEYNKQERLRNDRINLKGKKV